MSSAKELRLQAMNLLARREHSRQELYRKLSRRGAEAADIEPVLDQLIADKLLSDERFAEAYTTARARKGYGPQRIQQELQERGVSDDIIDSILASFEHQWLSDLAILWKKRWPHQAIDSLEERSKRWRFIQYRGYTWDQFKQLCEDYETISDS